MKKTNKLFGFVKDLFMYKEIDEYNFSLPDENTNIPNPDIDQANEYKNIFPTLSVNLEYLKVKIKNICEKHNGINSIKHSNDIFTNTCILFLE